MIKKSIARLSHNSYQVCFFFFIVNIPLFILTWDTGQWGDDAGLFSLYFTKQKISPLGRVLLDFLEPKTDGHLSPVYYLFNTLVNSVYSSPQWFHFVVILFHIGTSFVIFQLIQHTHQNRKLGLLAGTLFSLSYYICFKALAWNAFHSHVTNTFTGILSIYWGLKYLSSKKKKHLLLTFLFITLSLLNYESSFVFPVIIGIFSLFALWKKKTSLRIILNVILILILAVGIYAANALYFMGHPFPIVAQRMTTNHDEVKVKPPSNDFSAARSTYAPRGLRSVAIRTLDLTMKIFNLSFFESKSKIVLKSYIHDKFPTELERKALKDNIKAHAMKGFIAGGIIMALLFPLIAYFIFKHTSSYTRPYLLNFLVVFIIFVAVFNRVDIANAIAIFSSVVFSDLIFTLLQKRGYLRKAGVALFCFFLFMPTLIILDRFEGLYEGAYVNKANLRMYWRLYPEINRTIGHYTENAWVFVYPDNNRVWLHPSPPKQPPFLHADLSHMNIGMFQQEFIVSEAAQKYANRSYTEMSEAKELWHIRTVEANSKAEVIAYLAKHKIDPKKIDVVYVNEEQQVIKI